MYNIKFNNCKVISIGNGVIMYKINNLYKTLIGKTTITFFDIELINIKESIKETYDILSDSSWVNKLSNESLKKSYLQRIQYTINEL